MPSLAGGGLSVAFFWNVGWSVGVTAFAAGGQAKGQHYTYKAAKNEGAVHSDSCN